MLKLGSGTGSVINHMMSRSNIKMPEVGMGATQLHWSDRSPLTIIEVEQVGEVVYFTTQGDDAKRIDNNGMSDCQDYEYTPNPNGSKQNWRIRNGVVEQIRKNPDTGRWNIIGKGGIIIGFREKYYDFSF